MSLQLQSIYSYIANNLFNEPASFRLQNTIEQKLSTISTFPKIGSTVISYIDDVADEFSKVRKLNANKYIILYAYKEISNIAVITHIFHQSQNYGVVFQK